MSAISMRPDFTAFEIPMDAWSEPFWRGAAEHRLMMPKCRRCGVFRWPAGPFCPHCRSQPVDWLAPGQGRIYSFTIMPATAASKDAPGAFKVAALVEFDNAPGVRLVSVLVDAPLDRIAIGDAVEAEWLPAANATVAAFRLSAKK